MKPTSFLVALFPALCGALTLRGTGAADDSPVGKVVQLLKDMEARGQASAKKEQRTYDRLASWCEDTTARKSKDIAAGQAKVDELDTLILKLSGETATHAAEASSLKKAIEKNMAAQKEASEVRDTSRSSYEDTKTESEQSLGALEAAIKALSGAGEGKLVQTSMEQARFLTVAAAVRPVLERPVASRALSTKELATARRFAERPQDFVKGSMRHAGAAIQVGNNPFGDYAPQSTQIQGILKGLYDTFATGLEKATGEEAEETKNYRELMATKRAEAKTLSTSLEQHSLDEAEKSKLLADSKLLREDTTEQLEADKKFFESTKKSCRDKAAAWSERSMLRAEELEGIATAIEILTDPAAKATFANASATFLQLHSIRSGDRKALASAVRRVRLIATGIKALRLGRASAAANNLAQVVAVSGTAGPFDAVMKSIDEMIEVLRAEEADDVAHRDRCEEASNKNVNAIDDLENDIRKANASIDRLDGKMKASSEAIAILEGEINATNFDLETALKLRNKEHAEFVQALKDDKDSVELIKNAIVTLQAFYTKNKIPMALLQAGGSGATPEYSVDKDKMPGTEDIDGSYKGNQGEHSNIIGMLTTIKEDLEKEIRTGKKGESDDQAEFEADRNAMRKSLLAQTTSKVEAEKQLAALAGKREETSELRGQKESSLDAQSNLKSTLDSDCAWVKTHFKSRRTQRKAEIGGLQDAKDFLAGMESGTGI